MYYNENYPSDREYISDENHNEQIKNEELFDKYCDELKETYDEILDYVKYRSKNKNLLKNLSDYMYLEPILDDKEFEYSETFIKKKEIMKKYNKIDNIVIPDPPSNNIELVDKEKSNFVSIINKKSKKMLKRKEKMKKRKERIRIRKEKKEKEKMKNKTKNIMKNYGFL